MTSKTHNKPLPPIKDEADTHSPAELSWIGVESMRPTQCSVGFLEVELKMAELTEKNASPGSLDKYLRKHPIPAVKGPDFKIYLTDHHHMGLALRRLERAWDHSDRPASSNPFRKTCFAIFNDYSASRELSMGLFFAKMESHALLHPYGSDGRRVAPIPESLDALVDDPYRSLAGLARKAGAYDKVLAPFTEFKWADYFRERVPVGLIAMPTLADAVKRAVDAANDPSARLLPGYHGNKKNQDLPTLADIAHRLASLHGAEDDPGLTSKKS